MCKSHLLLWLYMATEEENLLHLGADLDKNFVLDFRKYCRLNDFKQKTLIRRLVECWRALDPIAQEHIYRGRLDEVFPHSAKAPGSPVARDIVARSKAHVARQKRKPAQRSSKTA